VKTWHITSTALLGIILLSGSPVLSQGNSQGHGHGKGHDKHHDDDRDDHDGYHYDSHQEAIRGWYSERESHLPPGLAKKDRLPPGLEKQLVRNGTLPPVLISGHIVLLNRKTNLIVDVFGF
jgi:hypothetical protein